MPDYWGNLDPPVPLGDIDSTGKPNWAAFRRRLREDLLSSHRGANFQVTTKELAVHYFGRDDRRALEKMGAELQRLRLDLEIDNLQLVNLDNSWWVADTPEDYLRYGRKGMRHVLGKLLRVKKHLEIGAVRHPAELGEHPAVRTIGGVQAVAGELEAHLDTENEEDGNGSDNPTDRDKEHPTGSQ